MYTYTYIHIHTYTHTQLIREAVSGSSSNGSAVALSSSPRLEKIIKIQLTLFAFDESGYLEATVNHLSSTFSFKAGNFGYSSSKFHCLQRKSDYRVAKTHRMP